MIGCTGANTAAEPAAVVSYPFTVLTIAAGARVEGPGRGSKPGDRGRVDILEQNGRRGAT